MRKNTILLKWTMHNYTKFWKVYRLNLQSVNHKHLKMKKILS